MRLRLRLCIIYSLLRLELFGFLQCPLLGSRNAAFNFRTDGGSGPWNTGKGLMPSLLRCLQKLDLSIRHSAAKVGFFIG